MGNYSEKPLEDEGEDQAKAAQGEAEAEPATIGEHDPNAGDEQAEKTATGEG